MMPISMSTAALEQTFERTFAVNGPANLEVNLDSGVVRVSVGEPGAIRVRGILRARRWLFGLGNCEDRIHWLAANPPIRQDGNSVLIEGDFHDVTILLDIAVPRDTRVQARTDSGDIRVEGVTGPVLCESDSGRIEIGDIDGGVRATSDSGSIEIRGLRGGLFAETDSGAIDAVEVAGSVEAETDSGAIRIGQTLAAPVRARTDSGAIDLRIAPEAGYNLRVSTDSGSVNLPPLTFQRSRSPHNVEAQVLGGGPLVDIESDSGSVDIR